MINKMIIHLFCGALLDMCSWLMYIRGCKVLSAFFGGLAIIQVIIAIAYIIVITMRVMGL